jgi:hypothetical protein
MSLAPRFLFACLVLLGLAASAPARATDPCDLNTGASVFAWDQVMACYTGVPYSQADLDNAVAFISAARERSDLREVYEAQFGWRAKLATLGTQTFANDFAMQMALMRNHKEFYNPHWRYRRPWCYSGLVAAFMPFDFGSTVTRAKKGKQQQIVFIESAAFRPDLYAEFTGIDASQYVGMKVVSINGVDAMQFFRDFGRDELRFDTNDGENFNEAMQNAAYSIRISPTHDMPPDHGSDTYVLEQANGTRVTVVMPWVFAPRTAFGSWQDPLPSSTAQFQARCQQESEASYLANLSAQSSQDESAIASRMTREAGELDFVRDLREKRAMTQRLRKTYGGNNAIGYFDVPPGNMNMPLISVVPKNGGAAAYAIDDKATILRLDDFVQDWKAEVIAATDYACANTDRLVIDMRNNGGGYVDQVGWLTGHLFPERTTVRELSLVGRMLNSNTGRNDFVSRMTQWVDTYYGPGFCAIAYEPACFLDPDSGQRLTALDWYTNPVNWESRGGQNESLTRLVGFSNDRPDYVPGTDPIACPGKFQGNTLVLLTNGTGASGGYFFPEAIRDQSVFVSAGGLIGEPLVSGIARGGAVWGMNGFEAAWEQWFIKYYYGPAVDPLPYMVRDADSYMEQPGMYDRDGNGLTAEANSLGNTRIDVWADSPETDGYVYRKVIGAAQSWKPGH